MEKDILEVVEKYNETQLKIDVLDQIVIDAQILLNTEKAKERLRWHPCTDFLREFSGEHDLHIFHKESKAWMDSFRVQSYSNVYDETRNVKTSAKVRYNPPDNQSVFVIHYHYQRYQQVDKSHQINFTLCFGTDSMQRQKVIEFEMTSAETYPAEKENSSEHLNNFSLDEDAMADLMNAFQSYINLNPLDILQIILAFPYHEDEWMIDDRILDLLFSGEPEAEMDSDHVRDE